MKTLRFVQLSLLLSLSIAGASESSTGTEFPFKANDRVAWIGSSSTRIGTWCRTMEFLLRTRHPELNLVFFRGTTGGGTFATGIKYLSTWMDQCKPTYVLFNYGGNDAGSGPKGLEAFKANMQKCLEIVTATGARAEFVTPQSADVRAAGQQAFDNRRTFSETMVSYAQDKHWTIYDVHHPLERLQLEERKELDDFTINRDKIHLTDCGYIAWGFYLYDSMNPPERESSVELDADGKVLHETRCHVDSVNVTARGLTFTRKDEVLPLLPPDPVPAGNPLSKGTLAALGASIKEAVRVEIPPVVDSNILKVIEPPKDSIPKVVVPASAVKTVPSTTAPAAKPVVVPQTKIPAAQVTYAQKFGNRLPPRTLTPLEKCSRYMLRVRGLAAGNYTVSCEGKTVGTASASQLSDGVNLNSLVLDSHVTAPWNDLVKDLWLGKRTREIGHTSWTFSVQKVAE